MNDLIELVSLLNRSKLRVNGAWELLLEPNSRMAQLFDGIARREVHTDDEATSLLYGGDDRGLLPSLKNKLKDRLLDAVLLLDYKESSYSTRQKAFFECYKRWAVAMTLMTRGAKTNGVDQLQKLLRHTMRFEFTELTLDILRVLRLQYSTVDGDIPRYEAVREQYRTYEAIWQLENRAEDYYASLMVYYTNSKSTRPELQARAAEYFAELEPHLERYSTFKLHLFGRLIELLVYSTGNDYANTARVCESAIAFFDTKDYESGLPLQVFYYNLLICCLQLRQFERGRELVEKSAKVYDEGSFNWFKVQELYFLLALHTAHYDEAWEIYQRVSGHPQYESQLPQIVEMWKIYQAYVYYLLRVGRLVPASGATPRFRLQKFLNEIALFSRDKRGMNIAVLIVQILFSIVERDYDGAIDRIEAIEKYCNRYLKENDTFRSNCFIKMLLQIPLGNFHRAAVERKAAKYVKLLQSVPLEDASQTHEVEIVPYEQLWEMALETLGTKIHTPREKAKRG